MQEGFPSDSFQFISSNSLVSTTPKCSQASLSSLFSYISAHYLDCFPKCSSRQSLPNSCVNTTFNNQTEVEQEDLYKPSNNKRNSYVRKKGDWWNKRGRSRNKSHHLVHHHPSPPMNCQQQKLVVVGGENQSNTAPKTNSNSQTTRTMVVPITVKCEPVFTVNCESACPSRRQSITQILEQNSSQAEEKQRFLSCKRLSIFHHRSTGDIREEDKELNLGSGPPSSARASPVMTNYSSTTFSTSNNSNPTTTNFQTSHLTEDEDDDDLDIHHPIRHRSGSLAEVERVSLSHGKGGSLRLGEIEEADEESLASPKFYRSCHLSPHLMRGCVSTSSTRFSSTESLASRSSRGDAYLTNTSFIPEGVIVLDDECIFQYPSIFHGASPSRRDSVVLSQSSANTTPNLVSRPMTPLLTINDQFPLNSPEISRRLPCRNQSYSLRNTPSSGGVTLTNGSFRKPRSPKSGRRRGQNSPKVKRREVSELKPTTPPPPDPTNKKENCRTSSRGWGRKGSMLDLLTGSSTNSCSTAEALTRKVSLSTTDLTNRKSIKRKLEQQRRKSAVAPPPIAEKEGWHAAKKTIKLWKSRISLSGAQFLRFGDHSAKNGSGESNSGTAVVQDKVKTPRRYSLAGQLESRGLPDVLLNVLGSGASVKSKDNSLPNALPPSSPGYDNLPNFHLNPEDGKINPEDEPQPQLVKQKWKDLDLWSAEPAASWSLKHGDIGHLSASEKKKQNIIYELYTTEKHHCQVIVFLQQAYQVELQKRQIVTEAQMKQLIPDVLDSLLDFHLRILRRMRDRLEESKVVRTIGDIILEEFEDGDFKTAAINAYTTFCLAREESYRVYSKYMERFSRFKDFFSFFERNPEYKGRSFKSCLLLIAQRLTKYPILMEQIAKYENGTYKEVSQKAHNAVKSFALRVDKELWAYELNRRWEGVRRTMDKTSVGQLLGSPFTYDDLVAQDPADRRKCLSIGTVYWPSVSGQKIELCMVLFDDIVVFLQNKNSVMQFFSQKDHASVIPLHTALIREMERTNEVMLIILAKKKPDMCRLFFSNKNEMHQWVQTIKSVRTANGPQEIETSKPVGDDAGDTDPDETAYNENISKWQKRLEILFNERMKQEEQLKDYFDERMKFFDSIRRHLKDFPAKTPRNDGTLLPSTAKIRENRDIERLKSVLQTRFSDLRDHRRSTLDQLIETSQKARDSDLASFFDDLFELGQGGQPSSSSNDSSANYSDENEENNGNKKRGNKPRRARTYHGTADSQKSSSSSTRRHTTVPKVGSEDLQSGDEDASFNDQVDEDIRKLPARKAATDLIRENVSMRIENNKLRKEIALQDLHIASLRAQRKSVPETSEKLESLRQKYDEIQRQERDFKMEYEKRMDNLKAKQEQLDSLESALKQREAQMETMSSTFTMTSDTNSKFSSLSSSASSASNPHRPLSSTMRGKMPTFRSGSAIHELNTADSVKSGNLTDRPFSTVEKCSNSDIHVMPRHLVVKTETKLADKRRSKK